MVQLLLVVVKLWAMALAAWMRQKENWLYQMRSVQFIVIVAEVVHVFGEKIHQCEPNSFIIVNLVNGHNGLGHPAFTVPLFLHSLCGVKPLLSTLNKLYTLFNRFLHCVDPLDCIYM